MNAVLWHLKRNKRKSSVYWCNETTIGHRAAVTGIDYPAALSVMKPVERRLGTLKKHLEQADIYFKYKGKKPLTEAELPPPCPLSLHILLSVGLLFPLFLPQDTVNALSDFLRFFQDMERRIHQANRQEENA